MKLQCENSIWSKLYTVFWMEIFQHNSFFSQRYEKNHPYMHPNMDVWNGKDSKKFTLQMSSPFKPDQLFLCDTHTQTAPALALRKLPFSFWCLLSFAICPVQCKAGKSRQCLGSSSCGRDYQKPCCKPVKRKDCLQNSSHHLTLCQYRNSLQFVLPCT